MKQRRLAIVTLHSEGWNVKSIASYLKTSRRSQVLQQTLFACSEAP